VVLLGTTQAIEGFLPRALKAVQFKDISGKHPDLQGGVVDAFLKTWASAKSSGFRDIWLYVNAPQWTAQQVTERWGRKGTQPVAEQTHFDGTVSKIIVFCSVREQSLPLRAP